MSWELGGVGGHLGSPWRECKLRPGLQKADLIAVQTPVSVAFATKLGTSTVDPIDMRAGAGA